MSVISGPEALAAFRLQCTGEWMVELLRTHGGQLLITWPVGAGKSQNMDQTIEAAIRGQYYDLVVVLSPTRYLLEERRWIQTPPGDIRVENLKPRPHAQCGSERDRLWKIHEKANLGALGRCLLCGSCPQVQSCFWPRQYKRLQGAQVIFATQAHLERSPTFLLQLTRWTGASRVLVLLDEVNFLSTSFHRRIATAALARFVDILKHLLTDKWGKLSEDWLYQTELLLHAPTRDLRCPDWRLPFLDPEWVLAIQEAGWTQYGENFQFLGYDLQQFVESPLASRERASNGDLLFAALPALHSDFVVYSGTAQPEFTHFRLGRDFVSPFAEYRFEHPETVWYNLASRLGMRQHFPKNAPQLLDFFASLVARRLQEGRRPLLIAKQCFVAFCAQEIERRLQELGCGEARVVWQEWQQVDFSTSSVVPLIHYGLIGTNLFEAFDCAYCLTGYYVNESVVNDCLQDVLASDSYLPLKIVTRGRPLRRTAGVIDPQHQGYDVHPLAQQVLNHLEMGVAIQAVGRVRPYTRPREIVTFQCAAHPQLTYTQEFHTLGEARRFFALSTRRTRLKDESAGRVQAARAEGFTQKEAARRLGVSLRTIKRYWNTGG